LNEDLRSQLEKFLRYTEEKKMPLSLCRCNAYESKLKGETVFRIVIANGESCKKDIYAIKIFTVKNLHFSEDRRDEIQNDLNNYFSQLENNLSEYSVNHLSRCRSTCSCKPGIKLDILGKSYSGICCNDMSFIRINNPNEKDYTIIKKLIDIRKQNILQKNNQNPIIKRGIIHETSNN